MFQTQSPTLSIIFFIIFAEFCPGIFMFKQVGLLLNEEYQLRTQTQNIAVCTLTPFDTLLPSYYDAGERIKDPQQYFNLYVPNSLQAFLYASGDHTYILTSMNLALSLTNEYSLRTQTRSGNSRSCVFIRSLVV